MGTALSRVKREGSKNLALRYRLVSAVVLIPIVAVLVYLGGPPFFVAALLIAALASHEFSALVRRAGHDPLYWFAMATTLLFLLDAQLTLGRVWLPDGSTAIRPALSLVILASLSWQMLRKVDTKEALISLGFLFSGTLYVGWLFRYYVLLRGLDSRLPGLALPGGLLLERGALWLALVVVAVWICDSVAYLVGSAYGRRKVLPRISPSKTWEGTLAGVAGAWLWGALAGSYLGMGVLAGSLLGLVIGISAVLGDLSESMIKRGAAAKDSSGLIPGHGGMLDRLDSMLFAGVVAYYFVVLFQFAGP